MVTTKAKRLHIYMNGYSVATLDKSPRGGLVFKYKDEWLETQGARPISLSLPLRSKQHSGDFVFNFFDNLLPDNLAIRSRIQAKFQIATSHPFDLLACIGKDCIGAIALREEENIQFNQVIRSEKISHDQIAEILEMYKDYPLGMNTEQSDFRISLAGAQEKAAFLKWKGEWNIPLHDSPTSHIFKLPIGHIAHQDLDLSDSCENEWLCSRIAKAFGFEVANCEMEQFGKVKALVVERFDRRLISTEDWILRLPQEDMCQALGMSSHLKYQSDGGPSVFDIMTLLNNSEHSTQDRVNFYKAQILFWLLCAIDGHAKNFSLFIGPGGRYRLTPLYDIMSAYPLIACKKLQSKKVKMAMSLKGKNHYYHWYSVQRRHFVETGVKTGFSAAQCHSIIDEILDNVDLVIERVEREVPLEYPEELVNTIFQGMKLMRDRLTQTKGSNDR